ncbi:MAG: hypothetical protein ACREOO_06885, partial [bacterium]
PRAFREQLGESMAQTFNDLCNERKQQTERGLFGLVLWMFVETAIGIIKEHILQITQGDAVKNIITNLRSAAISGFILVLPFMILELINRRSFHEGFPIPLFGLLWFLPMILIVILTPLVRNVRAGNSITANPITLLLRVGFSALIAMMWVGILIDQFPCFMGVQNCD